MLKQRNQRRITAQVQVPTVVSAVGVHIFDHFRFYVQHVPGVVNKHLARVGGGEPVMRSGKQSSIHYALYITKMLRQLMTEPIQWA